MVVVFYVAGAVALLATVLAITRRNAVHALLYLIVSLLSLAVVLYVLGAPFVAALEVIVYAGAIMVLFVMVVMLLNLGRLADQMEAGWLAPRTWAGPAALALVLAGELVFMLLTGPPAEVGARVGPQQVGVALFGPYVLGVELASFLLMAGLVGAYHLGRREEEGGGT
jgi:NADH-quinone oxidoreductase subunit J